MTKRKEPSPEAESTSTSAPPSRVLPSATADSSEPMNESESQAMIHAGVLASMEEEKESRAE